MKTLLKKINLFFTRMSQETFDKMMFTILFLVLFTCFVTAIPSAFDGWFNDNYEKPLEYLKNVGKH